MKLGGISGKSWSFLGFVLREGVESPSLTFISIGDQNTSREKSTGKGIN